MPAWLRWLWKKKKIKVVTILNVMHNFAVCSNTFETYCIRIYVWVHIYINVCIYTQLRKKKIQTLEKLLKELKQVFLAQVLEIK